MSTTNSPGDHDGWFKSSYSNGSGGECVEVHLVTARAAVRDSKRPGGPHVSATPEAWEYFVGALREGRLG
ncbi:DUF397 domain-containing protein [Streptomyces sp. NPDC059909]|uniref:DUF397 domain-containing protein n=1 Tax=Streptomyces sp. NPDC059909 TaxID=3346998 RepID=UPI00366964D5